MQIFNNTHQLLTTTFLQVKPNKKDAELATLRLVNAELNEAMAWTQQRMKNMQEDWTKDRTELAKLRKECWLMAEENETLREKVAGALKTLMGDWDNNDDEDDN